jgi:uncharacterized protein (DUF2141 family)
MRYLFSLFIISSIIIYFLTECASITPPGGGPRDTIPPVLIKSIPENKSLHFSGNSIRLIYDEYLKIDNLLKQLIITPIIQDDYDQKIRRNSIELTFSEVFRDSTTFTFNFQDAIQDITEGNVTLDNVLAFSTGDYIDSLYINGRVNHIFTDKPMEGCTVCLYNLGDTLNIFNSQPIYLTKTNKEGKYLIENIKNGTYRLYVYNDANSNLICDMPREMFGFTSDTIYLNENIDSVFLKMQYLDMRDIKIQRADPAGPYYEIKINKNIVDYTVQAIDTSQKLYHNFGEDKKTIRFYDNLYSNDSIKYIFTAVDSLDNEYTDTLYLKFIESKRDKNAFEISLNPDNNSKITDEFKGVFNFNKPITFIRFDSMYFKYDSVTFQSLNDTTNYVLNERKDVFTFDIDLFFSEYIASIIKADTISNRLSPNSTGVRQKSSSNPNRNKLIFHVGKGAFISADQDSSTSFNRNYQLLRPEDYGIIKGNVLTEFNSFSIQLMKGGKEVVNEIYNQKAYEFINVEPGQYTIRVIIDNNGNGKWDPGNIFDNIEPEDVFFYPEELTLRPNWELTDIDLSF